MNNAIWTPQDKQLQFMQRPEYEALYGGAAGGGKSDALLSEALRQVHIPHYRGLILRKTFPQLEFLIERSKQVYPKAFPNAKYNASKHFWRFPSGAVIIFGSLQHDSDRYNYQGKPYDFVAFDELTQFTKVQYDYLKSRNRASGKGTRVYIRATANPGGIGHGWVKERFITPTKPMNRIYEEQTIVDNKGNSIKIKKARIFVPSSVFDNKILLDNNPDYLGNLAMLPEKERNALLYGDWDSFEGQVFTEWRDDPQHYDDRLYTHVVNPFEIPSHWQIYRSFDFGYAKPFSFGWYAVSERGKIYRIVEYYGCTGEPNVGLKIDTTEMARHVKEIEEQHPLLKGKTIYGVADPSIYDRSRGESIAQMFEKHPFNINFEPADNTRIAGKMQCHYRLAFNDEGEPMFQVFNTCKHFIRTIPTLVYSESHVEDINTDMEDHIYDEWRYLLMQSPISPPKKQIINRLIDDPLNLDIHKYMKPKTYKINF